MTPTEQDNELREAMTQQPHIQGLEELYDNWFYSLAGEEPDGTYTLTVHEVHDGEAYSKLEELITAYTNKQIEAKLAHISEYAENVISIDENGEFSMKAIPLSLVAVERNKLKGSKNDQL